MERTIVKISSTWGVSLENLLIDQNSDILAIILPGMGYTKDKPLLNFTSKLCINKGFDIFSIEYGFQIAKKPLDTNNDEEISNLLKETIEAIESILNKRYKKLVFIGKSIGTVVITRICNQFDDFEQVHILLTPVDATYENKEKYKTLVITGTNDPMINKYYIDKMFEDENIKVIKTENGNHSLECCDVFLSIDMIKRSIMEVDKFLKDTI